MGMGKNYTSQRLDQNVKFGFTMQKDNHFYISHN